MTDLVKCDRCGTPFSIQTAGIRATWSGDYMVSISPALAATIATRF